MTDSIQLSGATKEQIKRFVSQDLPLKYNFQGNENPLGDEIKARADTLFKRLDAATTFDELSETAQQLLIEEAEKRRIFKASDDPETFRRLAQDDYDMEPCIVHQRQHLTRSMYDTDKIHARLKKTEYAAVLTLERVIFDYMLAAAALEVKETPSFHFKDEIAKNLFSDAQKRFASDNYHDGSGNWLIEKGHKLSANRKAIAEKRYADVIIPEGVSSAYWHKDPDTYEALRPLAIAGNRKLEEKYAKEYEGKPPFKRAIPYEITDRAHTIGELACAIKYAESTGMASEKLTKYYHHMCDAAGVPPIDLATISDEEAKKSVEVLTFRGQHRSLGFQGDKTSDKSLVESLKTATMLKDAVTEAKLRSIIEERIGQADEQIDKLQRQTEKQLANLTEKRKLLADALEADNPKNLGEHTNAVLQSKTARKRVRE